MANLKHALKSGLASVLVAALLAGCQGEPEPKFDPDAELGSSAGSTSASPVASGSPSFDPTAETGEEFLRRWIRIGNEMQRTGDVDAYRAISAPRCQACDRFASSVEKLYANGGFIRTRGERITTVHHDGRDQWTVDVHSAPTRYRETSSGAIKSFKAGDIRYVVFMRKFGGVWQIRDYSQVAT